MNEPSGDGRQLALPFRRRRVDFRATPFLWAPSNETARAFLAESETWPHRRMALWGASGSGKTHLLHVWAAQCGAALLDGAELAPRHGGPCAIDDADRCGSETTLLHLLNRCAEAGDAVLLAARTPPARWVVSLPDLGSRLRATLAVELATPEESLLRALLARLLADRQLRLSGEKQDWLLLRLPRTAAAVREAVDRLEDGILAGQRAPGRALLQDIVDAAADPVEASDGGAGLVGTGRVCG